MFQLTYTSCRPGMSVNGSGGYAVRAVSAGVDPAWLQRAPELARCDTSPWQPAAPARLAFYRKHGANIVTHTLRTLDHETRLATFTHAVIDPSGQIGAREAIGAWHAPFWKRANDDGPVELPAIQGLPSGDVLSWTALQRQLELPVFTAMAQFAIAAWLLGTGRPIILFADESAVAAILWLLAHSLPASLLADLSFATIDHNPNASGVALVGCVIPKEQLPHATLAHRHWFNALDGECTAPAAVPYAEWVVREAKAGRPTSIDAMLRLSEELAVQDSQELGVLHRVANESHDCTEADLLAVRRSPKLLRWLLRDTRTAGVAAAHIGQAGTSELIDDRTIVEVLLEQPEQLDLLVNSVLDRGLAPVLAPHWSVLLESRHALRLIRAALSISIARLSPADIVCLLRAALPRIAGLVSEADAGGDRGASVECAALLARQLARRIALLDTLMNPATNLEDISVLALSISELPETDRRSVFQQLLPRLLRSVTEAPPSQFRQQLPLLLELAITHATNPPDEVLRRCAQAMSESGRLLRESIAATTMLSLAFGNSGRLSFAGSDYDDMVDLGVEMVALFARAAGPAFNREVAAEAVRWPEPARSYFRIASRPYRINGAVKAFLARRRAGLSQR